MRVILALFVLALAGPALAQEIKPGTVSLGPIYAAAVPYLMQIVSALVGLAIAWIAARVHRWTGVKIEAEHRAALQSALSNGAASALARFQPTASGLRVNVGSNAAAYAIAYVERSVPDAVGRFNLGPDRLRELLEPHFARVAARIEPPPPSAG